MSRSHSITSQSFQQPEYLENHLFKIIFYDSTVLSAISNKITTVPSNLHLQIMSTLKAIHCYSSLKLTPDQQPNDEIRPIKVGQLFYLQLYFLNKYLYFNSNDGRYMLSKNEKTAFKILSQYKNTGIDDKYWKKQQNFESFGKIKFGKSIYHLIIADQQICLKSNGSSVYPGKYDEKARISIYPSLYSLQQSIYNNPCLLYSLQDQKYVSFDLKNLQMKLTSQKIFLQCLCRLQRSQQGVKVRIVQENNQFYLSAKQVASEVNGEVVRDLSKMLKNITFKQSKLDSFSSRKHGSISYKMFQGISEIIPSPIPQTFLDKKEDRVAKISIKKYVKKNQDCEEHQFIFNIRHFLRNEQKNNIFLYKQAQKLHNHEQSPESIEYFLDLLLPNNIFILKENNTSSSLPNKNNNKSLLRIQTIGRQQLFPYVSFFSLYQTINLWKHNKQIGKNQFDLIQTQSLLKQMLEQYQNLQENKADQLKLILCQLIDLKLLTLLVESILAITHENKINQPQFSAKWVEKLNRLQEQSFKLILKLIVLLINWVPQKIVSTLILQNENNLLVKLSSIDVVFRQLIKITYVDDKQKLPQKIVNLIENKLIAFGQSQNKRAYGLCCLWGADLLKKQSSKIVAIQDAIFNYPKSHNKKINQDFLLVMELMARIKHDGTFMTSKSEILNLSYLQNQQILFQVRQSYLNRILSYFEKEIRLPLVLKQQSNLAFIFQHYKLSRQNEIILMTYLQDVIPDINQIELVQNKIIGFGVLQLMLQLYQDFSDFLKDICENRTKSYGVLIAHIQKNIAVYKYEPQFLYKYLRTAIKTLSLIHLHFFRYIAYQTFLNSPHLNEHQIKLKAYQIWNSQMKTQSWEQQKQNHSQSNSMQKIGTVSKISRKQFWIQKTKVKQDVVLGSKITDFLFQRSAIDSQMGMDRQYIWEILNGKHASLCLKKRLDIFEQIIQLLNLKYNPSYQTDECIQNTSECYSNQFIEILLQITQKAYLNRMPEFIKCLNNCQMSDVEWRVLISIINKNKLLPYFLTNYSNKQKQLNFHQLFHFLLRIFKKYMQFSKQKQTHEIRTKQMRAEFHYLLVPKIISDHQLQPQNFIKYLKNEQPTYDQTQIELHFQIVSHLGVITNQQYFRFYMHYIIRYECQDYNKQFIQLALLIFQTLPHAYKQLLSNTLCYSYFKQHQVLKELIISVTSLKQLSSEYERQEGMSPQKRPSNFKFLLSLDKEEGRAQRQCVGNKGQQMLCLVFQLFTEVVNYSKNSKNFVSKIGHSLFYDILESSKKKISLKASLNLFLFSYIKKAFMFVQENYRQQEKDMKKVILEKGQFGLFIQWIKGTNNFLYKQIDYFKTLIGSDDELKGHINYIAILLQKLALREEIADYFMPNRLLKVKYNLKTMGEDQNGYKLNQQSNQSVLSSQNKYFNLGKSQINQNQLANISQINQILAYQLVQKLEKILTDQELTPKISDLLFWLQTKYGISSTKMPSSIPSNKTPIKLVFPFTNQQKSYQKQEESYSIQQYQKMNDFLRPRVQNYLVLLIELLQRVMVLFLSNQTQKVNLDLRVYDDYRQKVRVVLNLIELCLEDQIIIYQELYKQNEKKLYQVLPVKYKQISDFENRRLKKKKERVQSQKCCLLQSVHLEVIFNLLLKCFSHKDYYLVDHLNLILEKSVLYNTQNQINLQNIIQKHFNSYFDLVHTIITHFKNTSPLISYRNFAFYNIFQPQRSNIYGNSLLQTPPSSRADLLKKYGEIIGASRGLVHYQNELKCFNSILNVLLATSKYLNFNFKQILSRSTIHKQSLLHQLLELLQSAVNNNIEILTLDKLQLIESVIKLIIAFLRGPIQPNIYICVNRNYYVRVLKKLLELNSEQVECSQEIKICLLRIRKTVAQTLFIINPYMPKNHIQVKLIEEGFRNAYWQSRKIYKGNYQDIIIDYNNPQKKLQKSLLLFDLALNYFYFLIQFYSITGNNTIKQVQMAFLEQYEKNKKYQSRWKILYKLYRLASDIIQAIQERIARPQQDVEIIKDTDKLYVFRKAIEFFTKHVGNIDVKIEGKTKTISFLLLKQTKCRTLSIRNQLHRWVGTDQRALRLNNFLAVSKYIILRLQIEASITRRIENFKPLWIIVKKKQLWKNLSFLLVLIINLIYMFVFFFANNLTSQQLSTLIKVFLGLIYLFQVFLFIVYVVQILPLKIKLYRLINQESFRIFSIFTFVQDKTLFFVIIYTIFVSMAYWNLTWISILTLDYFYRFKTSDQITKLLFKCLKRIVLIIILIGVILFAASVIELSVKNSDINCPDPVSCTQQNFSVLMGLNFNVFEPVEDMTAQYIVILFVTFFIQLLIVSLLVGVIFAEQKAQNDQQEQLRTKIRHNCFICGNSQNEIEKQMKVKQGFYLHLRLEHNLWNYIYYLIYLKNRDKKYLNSIQSLIVQKWHNNDIDWLPDQLTK